MNWLVFSKYVMVAILDSAGHRLRRYTVAPQWVGLWISTLILLISSAVVLIYHGVESAWIARQALQLQRQNKRFQAHIQTIEQHLPTIQHIHERNQNMVRDLSIKSGLTWSLSPQESSPQAAVPPQGLEVDKGTTTEVSSHPFMDNTWAIDPTIEQPWSEIQQNFTLALTLLEQQVHRLEIVLSDTVDFFRDAANLLASTPSIRPAKTPWLTSSFGTRKDPIFHYWIMHKGLDLGGYKGMPIYAPADGTVIWTGRRGGYGLTVVIDHGYGLQTHFAHLSRYRVELGDVVRRGDMIAEMGSTGKSTGPHLHYEVRRHGQPLDPRRFILD